MKKLSFVALCFLCPVSFQETICSLAQAKSNPLKSVETTPAIPLTAHDVAAVLKDAGFPKSAIPVMTCLAEQESHFRVDAVNSNTNHTKDHGLFQVNDVWLDKCQMSPRELQNPRLNAKCALQIFNAQGFDAWSTYKHTNCYCFTSRIPPNQPYLANL